MPSKPLCLSTLCLCDSVTKTEKLDTENSEDHRVSQRKPAAAGWKRSANNSMAPRTADERNFGYSAAHEVIPVPLLPSGPGGVRGTSSHRARSSTHRQSRYQFLA